MAGAFAGHSTAIQKTFKRVAESFTAMFRRKEKHAEVLQFAAYKHFCDDTSAQKHHASEDACGHVKVPKADIAKYAAEAEKLTREIAEHGQGVSTWSGDQKKATGVRDVDKADYDTMHQDYPQGIEAR